MTLRFPVRWIVLSLALCMTAFSSLASAAADDPDLIFRKSTVFHWVSPNDKLATYAIDDPAVDGVACHFTVPEKGGFKGWVGVAEEVSDISLAETFAPRTTHRPVVAPRRCPALSRPRISSLSFAFGPKMVS